MPKRTKVKKPSFAPVPSQQKRAKLMSRLLAVSWQKPNYLLYAKVALYKRKLSYKRAAYLHLNKLPYPKW